MRQDIVPEYNPLHLEVMGIPVIICRGAPAMAQIGPLRGAFGPDTAGERVAGDGPMQGRGSAPPAVYGCLSIRLLPLAPDEECVDSANQADKQSASDD